MSSPARVGRKLVVRALTVVLGALALVSTTLVGSASAHGSVTDPPSRNYGCWQRWGSNFQDPSMATKDPMCWQAWQADPNAMWNWNGLYREGVAGNHQAAIPDGQLCSAGHTQSGRYNALDKPGNWTAAQKSRNFTLNIYDQALHGADYYRVYVTKQGFDPTTQPLGWGNLELVAQVGKTPPTSNFTINVNAPGRTGRHIVYTIWQASHMDQSYYWCSDVIFS
ncbi:lytic polysaccharide monooxygenase auxiliary activity family 9 protein [Goodfellowiella coeruleoviolacea]|uniref:Chitin-binding protein n=1 Tax=Goodfellowiella coeruleoviolacea TaxID=334858 RepID=A0AAE3KIK6_9PSEU|nr:lytic polysaccharide monooxygenase auxiliary activity family 9 protein [Goodfellowiella coeruleoviolacea]MCP2167494.1 chitin-binding protein [Goodfellowiella coeruleoviolacea]